MFRAKELHLYNIAVQREQAYQLLEQIQKYSVNLIDMQPQIPQTAREYFNNIKNCEDVLLKLNEIQAIIIQNQTEIIKCTNYEALISRIKNNIDSVEIEEQLKSLKSMQENIMMSEERRNKLYEQRYFYQNISFQLKKKRAVVLHSEQFQILQLNQPIPGEIDIKDVGLKSQRDLNRRVQYEFNLSIVQGTIHTNEVIRFGRIIFRTTKQNAYFVSCQIADNIVDSKGNKIEKSVFYIVFSSGVSDVTRKRILKVCEVFGVTFYDIPTSETHKNVLIQLNTEIGVINEVIEESKQNLKDKLSYFVDIHAESSQSELNFQQLHANGHCSYIEELKIAIQLQITTYYHLNFLKPQTLYYGQLWCTSEIADQLKELQAKYPFQIYQFIMDVQFEPPSLTQTNDFTYPFQELVNTYGLPRYGEINPALFTVITFPFLFGIMFGDIGHGGLLLIFGIYLIFFGKKLHLSTVESNRTLPEKELYQLYQIRYLLTLMGFFACYSGFIYNDFFSFSLNYVDSCVDMLNSKYLPDCIPQMGFDGAWHLSKDMLSIMNSFKMKTAIVIGVTHMMFGIILKGWNCLYQKRHLDFICDFIPQVLFMASTFGYMSFLITLKWLSHYDKNPPSIITTMLTMYFTLGGVDGEPMYPGQVQIQQILIYITLGTPFIMLYPKPIFKICKFSQPQYREIIEQHEHHEDEEPLPPARGGLFKSKEKVEETHIDFGGFWIEAAIETIEFVLGAVSNTASYLRLWALSLAHSQLSEVFFDMTLGSMIETGNIGGILIGFMVFAVVTFMVLMCMDTLECFLHALRLHWVEFQSKFYKADGHQYQPFNYVFFLENGIEFSSRM